MKPLRRGAERRFSGAFLPRALATLALGFGACTPAAEEAEPEPDPTPGSGGASGMRAPSGISSGGGGSPSGGAGSGGSAGGGRSGGGASGVGGAGGGSPGDAGTPRDAGSGADLGSASRDGASGSTPTAPGFTIEPVVLPSVIPILWIEVNKVAIGTTTKTPGKLRVIDKHDGTLADPMALAAAPPALAAPIGISVRGNFTAGLPKKQYALELRDEMGNDRDLSVLGLPSGSDFTLNASYTDFTFMRNPLSYTLGRELGRYAARFRWVEVYLDGRYDGLYILQEKVRRSKERVDVPKPAADAAMGDLTGGYIIRLEGPGKGGMRDWKSAVGTTWTYHYPTYTEITPAQKAYVTKYVDELEAALRGPDFPDPEKGYRKWFETSSWVDYAVISHFTWNFDAYWKSHYFSKQSDKSGGKLSAGPIWDFDNAYGLAEFARETNGKMQGNAAAFWKRLWTDPMFLRDLKCRWTALRKPGAPLTLESINAKLDAWDKYIAPARVRDAARWKHLVAGMKVFPNHLAVATHAEHVAFLRTWISERLKWIDANLPGTCS
jgi:hypothetical protein